MDNYGQLLQMQEQKDRVRATSAQQLGREVVDPYQGNPNVRIESEGQNVAVGNNGQIIYY